MKGYDDSRTSGAADIERERVLEGFDSAQCEHGHREDPDERAVKIARLRSEVRSGEYRADIMDIARLLTSAMDPTL
jgi:anti-sigma28 factor (negative regulator of flagellin synthesis)